MEYTSRWNFVQNPFNDYIEDILNLGFDIEKAYNLPVDDEGLITITKELELKKHAIAIKDQLLFPHSFLRRTGRNNFVEINNILSALAKKGNKVQLRLDPFKNAHVDEYEEIFERDYYYGPNFSKKILLEEKNFSSTLHWTNIEDESNFHSRNQLMTYPIKYTIFRPSWLDQEEEIIQYYIEELLLPFDYYKYNDTNYPPYSSEKYVAQKYIHFTFERKNNFFEHIDGAVRLFSFKEYKDLYEQFETTHKIYSQHIDGIKRYKLFKVQGKLSYDDISMIISDYLRYNPHIKEYFDDI